MCEIDLLPEEALEGLAPEASRDIELERLRSDMSAADNDRRSEVTQYLADVHCRLGGLGCVSGPDHAARIST